MSMSHMDYYSRIDANKGGKTEWNFHQYTLRKKHYPPGNHHASHL